ncbi:MAG: transcriptional regulator, AbrB family [Myxococcales bacterium]|nr:transcriptional regulator, AbrB family [Myxococcales bacterium]
MLAKRLTATATTATTVLSQKGQVVIPKQLRDQRGWEPGLRLLVESTEQGLRLRPVDASRTDVAGDLLGIVGYRGPKRSVAQMEAAIRKGARRAR